MTPPDDEHRQLAALLDSDPDNLSLIADTAAAAYAARRFDEAAALLERHEALAPLPPELCNLAGLLAMARGEWGAAVAAFEGLRAAGADETAVRFNLAWSLAMDGRGDEALALLDEEVVAEIAQAAQLRVGLLHERGRMEEAEAAARAGLDRFPDHRGLNAAVSTLAIDLEDLDLARTAAERAGDHPEALVTLGTLALGEDDPTAAGRLFDRVLAADPDSPRARVGRGLVALAGNDSSAAVVDLDRGAELFDSHPGSWIAAGWAHFLAGDVAAARERFERALAIDESFAEAQGSLAVASLTAGDRAEAERRAELALRLDRASLTGALATALLAADAGEGEKAQRIVALALRTPVDGEGRTLAQALARGR